MVLSVQSLAIPSVISLVSFLAFSSQYLLKNLEPRPLSRTEIWTFNFLVSCLLICYFRACSTHPGALTSVHLGCLTDEGADSSTGEIRTRRWCRKCERTKPARWHHCSRCSCVPKMDHHCVWISNCVSAITFPHFIRFLLFAVSAMCQLQYLLFVRFKHLWDSRQLPFVRCAICSGFRQADVSSKYLGPSKVQLVHLLLLGVVNSITVFALSVLLVQSSIALATNTATIEGWEIGRHHALLRRARGQGGFVYGPGGTKIWIEKQEFPYDIGIWQNLKQGMGTANFVAWFWPLSRSPRVEDALVFPTNDFNDPTVSWPPPDPDRIALPRKVRNSSRDEQYAPDYGNETELKAFYERQAKDISRWQNGPTEPQRRKGLVQTSQEPVDFGEDVFSSERSGEESWRNSNDERLDDFGVDEDVEFYDEEDIPLSTLIKRKKAR